MIYFLSAFLAALTSIKEIVYLVFYINRDNDCPARECFVLLFLPLKLVDLGPLQLLRWSYL